MNQLKLKNRSAAILLMTVKKFQLTISLIQVIPRITSALDNRKQIKYILQTIFSFVKYKLIPCDLKIKIIGWTKTAHTKQQQKNIKKTGSRET